jgi:DNA primase
MADAKNDPVKKADLIREIVVSISKVPDRIQREIYVQECSRIMDISEQVLVSTLAQMIQKSAVEAGKADKQGQKSFEVVKEQQTINTTQKVDVQNEIERKIIEILLLYGTAEEEFEDVLLRNNEEGEVEQYTEKRMYKVFDRVYLSLQEDEVELANPLFLSIYNNIMLFFRENEVFSTEHYLMQLPQELAQEVTNVLMDDEKVALHNWEAQNIIVKEKSHTISQYVTETILTLRWFLVDKIIEELKKEISSEPEADNTETLSMAMDYYKLIGSFSSKLGRVMSRYHN